MSFRAKYRGECVLCGDDVVPGQLIEFNDGRETQHVLCPDESAGGKPLPVCPRCFCVLPVTGECGVCFD